MGTNDEYWTGDAIKHYIDSIPGENFVHYVQNDGQDVGDKKQALTALSAFSGHTLTCKPYPLCQPSLSYTKREIKLIINATPDMVDGILWSANSTDTDFKNEKWEGKSLELSIRDKNS